MTYCESIRAIALLCPATHESFAQTPAKLHQVAATDSGSRHDPSGPAPSKTTAAVVRQETREDRQTARALLFARLIIVISEAVLASATPVSFCRPGPFATISRSSAPLAGKALATRSLTSVAAATYGVLGGDRVPSYGIWPVALSAKILLLPKLYDSA